MNLTRSTQPAGQNLLFLARNGQPCGRKAGEDAAGSRAGCSVRVELVGTARRSPTAADPLVFLATWTPRAGRVAWPRLSDERPTSWLLHFMDSGGNFGPRTMLIAGPVFSFLFLKTDFLQGRVKGRYMYTYTYIYRERERKRER